MRKWIFSVKTSQGDGYLLETGELETNQEHCPIFIDTDNQAEKEAIRRANAFEELTGERVNHIVYESQGNVTTEEPIG